MRTRRLRRLAAILGVVGSFALLTGCGARGPQQEPAAGETPPATTEPASTAALTTGEPCSSSPPCGDDCSNYPFTPNDCWTTQYGPAKADVIVGNPLRSTNMLYCEGGTYALCFFSGPPYATGKKHKDNRPLPCVLKGDVANCTCQAYTSGPYFVDINAILNQGAYYETVQACGQDGSKCANMENCGRDGKKLRCREQTPAPVCKYVQNQNPNDPTVSLMPKADLVSTFSFAMDDDYRLGSMDCDAGLYAGCMTAPCFFAKGDPTPPSDGEPVQCECPTVTGKYQVGQPGQECTIDGGTTYVWSAAYSVPADDTQ